MKKPQVDYRAFRFSKLNTPEYRHMWLLLGWVGYFLLYFLTENLIQCSACAGGQKYAVSVCIHKGRCRIFTDNRCLRRRCPTNYK